MATANKSGQEEKITALYGRLSDDDGVSGTTFERPGFKEMEALVEAGRVSTFSTSGMPPRPAKRSGLCGA